MIRETKSTGLVSRQFKSIGTGIKIFHGHNIAGDKRCRRGRFGDRLCFTFWRKVMWCKLRRCSGLTKPGQATWRKIPAQRPSQITIRHGDVVWRRRRDSRRVENAFDVCLDLPNLHLTDSRPEFLKVDFYIPPAAA